MKALLLDASPSRDDRTRQAANAMATALSERGCEVDTALLRDLDIRDCTGCFGCWVKTPGQCVIADDGRGIVEKWAGSDLVAVVTPITAGCYGSRAKRMLDRHIGMLLPFFTMVDGEIHHKLRYERYPAFLALGTLAESSPDEEELFARLVERNALNMHSPPHASGVVVGDASAGPVVARMLDEAAIRTEVPA